MSAVLSSTCRSSFFSSVPWLGLARCRGLLGVSWSTSRPSSSFNCWSSESKPGQEMRTKEEERRTSEAAVRRSFMVAAVLFTDNNPGQVWVYIAADLLKLSAWKHGYTMVRVEQSGDHLYCTG